MKNSRPLPLGRNHSIPKQVLGGWGRYKHERIVDHSPSPLPFGRLGATIQFPNRCRVGGWGLINMKNSRPLPLGSRQGHRRGLVQYRAPPTGRGNLQPRVHKPIDTNTWGAIRHPHRSRRLLLGSPFAFRFKGPPGGGGENCTLIALPSSVSCHMQMHTVFTPYSLIGRSSAGSSSVPPGRQRRRRRRQRQPKVKPKAGCWSY